MKKNYFTLLLLLLSLAANAQIFDVDTIQYKGNSDKFINIVIMGDGYTEPQQAAFLNRATEFTNSLFNVTPWSNYKNYFNVFAIKVISNETGTKHPNTASDCNGSLPVSNPDTYFGCTFDAQNIHRLVVVQSHSRVMSVLAANVPNYDQAIILANSSHYGGSGGTFAVSTTHAQGYQITAHELGHSFADLGDEYYAGDAYFSERPNMTLQNNPNLIKWKNWLTLDTAIGIHSHCCGGNTGLWYKPTTNACKMEILGAAYCSVCKESIIEKIHSLVNPIITYAPETLNLSSAETALTFRLSELAKPVPNTLEIKWQLDSTVLANNSEMFELDPSTLAIGTHTLTATVTDQTVLVRTTSHADIHFSTVVWTIEKTVLGLQAVAKDMQLSYALYPNPAVGNFTLALELSKTADLSVSILSLDGKIVAQIPQKTVGEGKYEQNINIDNLADGSYLVAVKVGGTTYTKTLVKQH